MASLSTRSPDSIDKHRAQSSSVGGNTSLSANEMVKVIGGWVRKVKMVVDSGNGSKHGVAATKDVGGRVATVRAEPTACI
jgi:hypothetical protein